MNLQNDPHSLAVMKFGIGQPVPRTEDPTLVRGEGRYTDDINLPGQAYAVIVRSRYAHGVHQAASTPPRRAKMPGVLGVYTGADLDGLRHAANASLPFKNRDGTPMKKPPRPALPTDKVRFVGDPIACVVAETLAQAKDAAEAVVLDIEPLPAVTTAERGRAARRAAALRRRARQRRARLSLRRQRQGRGRVRRGRACHEARARQQPHGRQRDGAARGDRRATTRRASASRCTSLQPGRVRHEGPASPTSSKRQARQGAHPHRQCRRLVRHEGARSFPNTSASCMRRARSAAR